MPRGRSYRRCCVTSEMRSTVGGGSRSLLVSVVGVIFCGLLFCSGLLFAGVMGGQRRELATTMGGEWRRNTRISG